MGPITPTDKLPLAFRIPSGLSPERTIFMEGFLNIDADWFEISLQCGPSLNNKDDVAFRLRLECFERYCTFKTDSLIGGRWKYESLYPKDVQKVKKFEIKEKPEVKSKIELVEKEIKSIESNDIVIRANMTIELPSTSGQPQIQIHIFDHEGRKDQAVPTNTLDTKTSIESEQLIKTTMLNESKPFEEQKRTEDNETTEPDKERRQSEPNIKRKISFRGDNDALVHIMSDREDSITPDVCINDTNQAKNDVGESAKPETSSRRPSKSSMKPGTSPRSSITSARRRSSFANETERALAVTSVVRRLSQASSIEEAIKTDEQMKKEIDFISDGLEEDNVTIEDVLIGKSVQEKKKKRISLKQIIRGKSKAVASLKSSTRTSLRYLYATDPESKQIWTNRLSKAIAILEDYLQKSRQHAGTQTTECSELQIMDESTDDFDILELQRGHEFRIALECLENGYLVALNEELFCAYPHHVNYNRVTYVVIDGHIRLEELEVEGGTGRDKTLVMDLYDAVVWSQDVIVLTDENFDELVLDSFEMWMVNAYTGWCPACNAMQWQWERAACLLRGRVKVGASDCDRNEELVDKLHIKYCPTIFYFKEGEKTFRSARIYDGIRLATCFAQFANLVLDGHVGLTRNMTPTKPLPKTLLKKRTPKIHPRKYREVNMDMDKVPEDVQSLIHTGECGEWSQRHVACGSAYLEIDEATSTHSESEMKTPSRRCHIL